MENTIGYFTKIETAERVFNENTEHRYAELWWVGGGPVYALIIHGRPLVGNPMTNFRFLTLHNERLAAC